jgi:hypothetical protein
MRGMNIPTQNSKTYSMIPQMQHQDARQPRKTASTKKDERCIEHCLDPDIIMFFGGDPFEHFAQHGHGGGGGGGRARRPAANVDTIKLYETLGVSFVLLSLPIHKSLRHPYPD